MKEKSGGKLLFSLGFMAFLMNDGHAQDGFRASALAAPGYSSAVNTPTADVLPWGGVGLGWSNGNPEQARALSTGGFGSLNAGLGVLPGLELIGRLAYEGDLGCNTLTVGCPSQRDLSVSGKYRLPISLPYRTRLALGFTDYGGAGTHFRQLYGVATGSWGPLDLSLGYSKPKSQQALMDGAFGSAVLRLTDQWSAALEHDSREARLGLQYRHPLGRDLALQLGVSRKLTDASGQQPWQMSAALTILLGGRGPDMPSRPGRDPIRAAEQQSGTPRPPFLAAATPAPGVAARSETPQPDASDASAAMALSRQDARPIEPSMPDGSPPTSPQAVAQALRQRGFSQVQVRYWAATQDQPALWQISAEPRRWRQSQVDAMGRALASWLSLQGKAADGSRPGDELLLSLTWQRSPVLHAYTSAACLDGWIRGWTRCSLSDQSGLAYGRALELHRELEGMAHRLSGVRSRLQQTPQIVARVEGEPIWMPQLEIGPGLRYNIGTEVGLLDYSVALEVGAEVSLADLAPGLFWQGVLSAPLVHSGDYDDGKPFAARRHQRLGLESSLLSWWKPLPHGVAAQASAGYIDNRYKGGMVDALWMNQDGRLRLSATLGSFEHDTSGRRQNPVLGSARWSLVPGAWQLEATAGRFLGGDKGFRLASHHWFGDTLFKLHYRDSRGEVDMSQSARHKFIGASVSFPLGPKAAYPVGEIALRGADRLEIGVQTKLGEDDNSVTYGYGEVPGVRHGLLSDASDHDRNGQSDLLAQHRRLRAVIAEQLAQIR